MIAAIGAFQIFKRLAVFVGDAGKTVLGLGQAAQQQALPVAAVAPPIATQCFMLSNMFDSSSETHPLWHQVILGKISTKFFVHRSTYDCLPLGNLRRRDG